MTLRLSDSITLWEVTEREAVIATLQRLSQVLAPHSYKSLSKAKELWIKAMGEGGYISISHGDSPNTFYISFYTQVKESGRDPEITYSRVIVTDNSGLDYPPFQSLKVAIHAYLAWEESRKVGGPYLGDIERAITCHLKNTTLARKEWPAYLEAYAEGLRNLASELSSHSAKIMREIAEERK